MLRAVQEREPALSQERKHREHRDYQQCVPHERRKGSRARHSLCESRRPRRSNDGAAHGIHCSASGPDAGVDRRFKDNARLQRGPDRSQPQPRPDHDQSTWRDPRSQPGQATNTPPPTALAPANTDPRTGDSRMTVPRAPTDRRQIQSGGTWTRIDGQSASFSRPTAQLPRRCTSWRAGGQSREDAGTTANPRYTKPSANREELPSDRDRAVSTPLRNESSGSARKDSSSGGDQGRSAGFVNRPESVAPRGQLSRPQASFNRP